MLHPLLIALVASLLVRDSFSDLPLRPMNAGKAAAATLIPLLLVGSIAHLAFWRTGRAMDRSGDARLLNLADAIVSVSRLALFAIFVTAVIVFGWLDAVRAAVGDLVGLDEALALVPALALLAWVWWAFAPIDRRLRDAVLLARLDAGQPIQPPPTRAEFVTDHMRHGVLIIAVPILFLVSWAELIDLLIRDRAATMSRQSADLLTIALQLVGVLTVLSLAPLLLRYMWSTRTLGPGPMRDRLLDLCRAHRVRCARLLVWRSRTGMLNGAMVGILPWFRYVLLTDALLERLTPEQVEAVMAHEVAHARKHHLPWMLGAIIASVALCWMVGELAAAALARRGVQLEIIANYVGAAVTLAGILLGALVFGFVSRRFELQADAFAAKHLSSSSADPGGGGAEGERRHDGEGLQSSLAAGSSDRITPDASRAMSGALGAVALYNHIPPAKFTFRHGSIRSRQRALASIVGVPLNALPIDRTVRRIKRLTLIAIASVVVLAWFAAR